MITRSYTCLNRNCLNEFDSTEDHPPCPNCGGLRVKWLPRPVAIGRVAGSIDKDVRALADTYGMADINSPQRDRAATVTRAQPTGPVLPFQASQGWNMSLPAACLARNGASYCEPVNYGALPPLQQKVPGPQWKPNLPRPVIEYAHRPKGGLPNVS